MRQVHLLFLLTIAISIPSFCAEAFRAAKLAEMDEAIQGTISSNKMPGGVLWLEHKDQAYHKAYGSRALVPAREQMTEDTIFDAASLTKVVACTPAVMLLVERGKIDLEAPVSKYIPEFTGDGKERVTVRQLMTHYSGLRPDIDTRSQWSGYDTAIKKACEESLHSKPGTDFKYSDINFFVLGEIVHRVSGQTLDLFTRKNIFEPLGMNDTRYLPRLEEVRRIAPTEKIGSEVLRGVVHDPTARYMGGVAGHAGLFTTAFDLARYARMYLGKGTLSGFQLFKPETVALMTSVQSPPGLKNRRGLGWDIDSEFSGLRGHHFPLGSYGHTGFTGTSLWIDPFSETFLIFLSNRVHPSRSGNVTPLRARLADLGAEAVADFDFENVPGALPPYKDEKEQKSEKKAARVLNGIDVLKKDRFAAFKGLRIGLITNHTGTDHERNQTIDLLYKASNVQLKALFSPEHGIRGALDEKVRDSVDLKTGLPIYSLYGARQKPTPEQLKDLDALVYDIQDIGCRFYTYISTMGHCLSAAAEARIKMFVLDRVNPITADEFSGPVAESPFSFTAFHNVPVRTGMTMGELARMFNSERKLGADLTVVKVSGWKRKEWFDETELPWTNPSPNMRSLNEATLYPGIGLLETTALSVGRGTDTPFEVIGAPYINDRELAQELNEAKIKGVRFVPVQFTPTASVFKGQKCNGVNIILTDRDKCPIVDVGIVAAKTLYRLYPKDFKLDPFNKLLAHKPTVEAIRKGESLASIKKEWEPDLREFKKRRAKYLLY